MWKISLIAYFPHGNLCRERHKFALIECGSSNVNVLGMEINMKLTEQIIAYIEEHQQEAFDLLLELAQIPAPSNHEEKRAQFCRDWLEEQGAEGVYVDDALNGTIIKRTK